MQKKYQIFISSTFLDLKSERQAAQKAILNLGHIPAGMEMFPASNTEQLTYIYKIIDDCDYYVLIIGGRYGSLSETGLSYTEMEFDYAKKRGIPILVFLHPDVAKIEFGKVDTEADQRQKLHDFRSKASSGRIVKDWEDAKGLEAAIITSLTSAFTEEPQTGWRRDTEEPDEKSLRKISNLQSLSDAHRRAAESAQNKLRGFEDLDRAEIDIKFLGNDIPHVLQFSGRRILKQILPLLRNGLTKIDLDKSLAELIEHTTNDMMGIECPIEVSRSTLEDVFMFLEAFDIATGDTYEPWKLKEEKKDLMKAVFIPNSSLNPSSNYISDDEIPF
ncbi:MAG: DUF4062 domain-containing protein [Rhodobacteraceae bacterium]|nr:DUF4062 domain-containing protein [Paracoccaceae bacterium]